jgi:hypothetical protein
MSAIVGPIPPYQNLPIEPQNYNPSRFVISAIALGKTTTVTATTTMDYVVGQLTRLIIPPSFGCRQLNESLSYVISLPSSNSVELDLDTLRGVDPYIASTSPTPAQILPVGDVNMGIISSTGRNIPTTNIPGSFINVS